MAKRSYFNKNLNGLGSTGNNVDLDHTLVPEGEEIHYTNITARNETSSGSYATPGVVKDETFYPIGDAKSLPVGLDIAWAKKYLLALGGEKLTIRFEGTTTGDSLSCQVQGYHWVDRVKAE